MTNGGKRADSQREAEKQHVRRLPNSEGLRAKPFLAGASLDVDRAAADISVFGAMVASLPCGPGSLVLDVGAGPCWVSEWLQRLRFRTCSTDLAEDMLRIGRDRLAPGSWMCAADMATLPFASDCVDAIVCCAALHHVPDWPRAIEEFHRVLRPGGVAVLQEPGRGHHAQGESIAEMERFGVLEQDLPAGLLARACRRAGFTRAVVRPVALLDTGRARMLPPYPFWRQAPRLFFRKLLGRARAAAFERLQNLCSAAQLVIACKGDPWPDSRRPDTLVARLREVDCPAQVRMGADLPVSARILNTGLTRWKAGADASRAGQVRLGVSLLDPAGKLAVQDFGRIDLPADVPPGAEVRISGRIPSPPEAGPARLRFDLVCEGLFWFAARGSIAVERSITVLPAAPEAGA